MVSVFRVGFLKQSNTILMSFLKIFYIGLYFFLALLIIFGKKIPEHFQDSVIILFIVYCSMCCIISPLVFLKLRKRIKELEDEFETD